MSATTKDEEQSWTAITKNEIINEILSMNGDQYSVAIRAKIVDYVEDVFVVWLAVGVKYVKVNTFKS